MALTNNKNIGERSFTLFYCFWLAAIGFITVMLHDSELGVIAVFIMLGILTVVIRHSLKEKNSLKMVCNFYEKAHRLTDLEMLQTSLDYKKILSAVCELAEFDWVVLFLLDSEKNSFVATESVGIKLNSFCNVKFEQLSKEDEKTESDPLKLSFKLLHYIFKEYDFKGALAGATLSHDNIFYGCLLVGRYDDEKTLTSEDNFKLDLLSDEVSICLHNYQMQKELEFRANELAERQASIQRELEMARIVQEGALPRALPDMKGLKVATFIKPARFVGGDFIRYIYGNNPKQLGFLIGDVCGKGVPASLVMSVVYCLFKEKGNVNSDPAELMRSVNLSLKEFLGAGSHFNSTALWGVFDLNSMTFKYANAGHDFPLQYCTTSKSLAELPSTGTLLGIFVESNYETRTVKIEHGDKIIFYSDGLIDFFEAKEGCNDGYKYLMDFFKLRQDKSAEEIIKEISELVENNPTAIKDDITASVVAIE
ncbi:MAG: SpoIIE family protein phosphatase [Candidatus Riflebacteria bacterium]|nr:SpoIIE family protein phosphatase [Candidatus Riflebacteria bacterium]